MEKNVNLTDYNNQSLLTTPKPQASSTLQKQQLIKRLDLQKIPFTYSPDVPKQSAASISSLGILNVDDSNLNTYLNEKSTLTAEEQSIKEKWQAQRALSSSLLEKSKGLGLPSYYLKPTDCITTSMSRVGFDSTVNETDLMEKEKLSFKPEEVSTPRSSNSNSFNSKMSMFTSKGIAELSHNIRNSDMSLAELCNRYCNLSFNDSSLNQGVEIREESFVPGELAVEKLVEQENLWKKELNTLGGHSIQGDSIFSQYNTGQPSMSVSEFFHKKSELADLCFKKSPEKSLNPVPLIEDSISFVSIDESKFGIEENSKLSFGTTELENAFSLGDDTAKIAELISKTNKKRNSRGSRQIRTQENIVEHKPILLKKPEKTVKVVEPLKDSRNISHESTYFDNTNSVQTASSLDSLHGDKLPIETNRIELVWGCVRAGKRKVLNFTLRNKSQNKLRLQMASSNTCFKILSDHSEIESVSVLPILMYPAESRSFSVVFIPTSVGACVGKLNFTPVSSELRAQQQKRQILMMYGYGGHANVELQEVLKDTNMKMWLSLGKLGYMPQLHKKFEIQNIGNISAFSLLKFHSKALYESSKLTIDPSEIVLHPKEQISVSLTYSPTKDDAKHLFTMNNSQVMEIGIIQVITGAEAVRGRIRRLCNKLKLESGNVRNLLIEELSKKFPNEKMPNDLKYFSETVGSVKELMQNFDVKEITLTLEKDTERTLVGQIGGMDESSMFQSLCEYMNTVVEDGKLQSTACIVEPTNIILTPPIKSSNAVVLSSHSSSCLQFETHIEPSGILNISPREGLLSPGETILIKVTCSVKKPPEQQHFKLSIYVDNDVFEVDIKIIVLKPNK